MPAFLSSIKGRLSFVFAVIFILVLSMTAIIVYEKNSLEETLDNASRTGSILEALGDITTAINGMDSSVQTFAQNNRNRALEYYNEMHDLLLSELDVAREQTSEDNQERLSALQQLEDSFIQHEQDYYQPVIAAAQAGESRELPETAFTSLRSLLNQADTIEVEVSDSFYRRTERAAKKLDQLQLITLLAVAAILAMIVLLALPVVRSIANRLNEVIEVAEQVGQGDLSEAVEATGRDEISRVLKSFARMRNQLRKLVGNLQTQSEQLATSSSQVAESSDSISQATEEQSQASDQISAAIEELTVSIGHVSESARQAYDYSENAKISSDTGSHVIQSTVSSMKSIAEQSTATANQLHELSERSTKISLIVDQIQAIAEQTNLLALNAAIESARAGEHGRGFAVVADEVRQLAQRSSEATDEISSMVGGIQSEIEEAVGSMQRTVKVVSQGSQKAEEAGLVIEEIRNGAISTADVINQTSTALEEQTSVSQDVAQQVENIASMTVETAAAATQASSAAKSMREIAEELNKSVRYFKI
ncbi:methyl-accepting chemotaxis protein [Marinospirillum perlucidum]|uniref:methyl-accepting chemotaxis protein n=1 Tax=Marinospirillum perlucidum TaxID=1982602 RepID=UPI000DF27DAD|nr:methyl-accepting chemotaxis protein [Marinospirillum perlucidum]